MTSTAHLDPPPAVQDTWYCTGCNARFVRVVGGERCPQCGAGMVQVATGAFEDTLLARNPPKEPPARALRGLSDEFDELLGARLNVYRCDALLGCGGMGRVYLAFHDSLHRRCALKILSPRVAAQDVDYVARFVAEGRAAAALVHPNIVTTHAIGEANGYHFLEMEYISGRSLQQLARDEGMITPVRATILASQIAEGLSAAHRAGIVHRDLKPDNVLMSQHGVPKISDFGLAKRVQAPDGVPDHYLIGTPNYMAPELFQGRPATTASDVYALGVCYFVLLTGRLPFAGGTLNALMDAVLHQPLPNVREDCQEIPLEIAECLGRMLAKAPENRPADATEAAQLLKAVVGHVRCFEALLREAFPDTQHVAWTRCGPRYRLCLNLPDGRRQALFVEPSEHGLGEQLVLIYSVCCEAQPQYYEHALRLNSEIPHGWLAIRELDGKPMFVMVDTYPRSTVDAEEIRRSVLEVAFRADAVEKLLTGQDRH